MNEQDKSKKLITAKEVAKFLSIPISSVYRYARLGIIPSKIIGTRSKRFDLDEILAHLQKKQEP